MKLLKKVISVALVLSLVLSSNIFAGFVSSGAYNGSTAFDNAAWVQGVPAYAFINGGAGMNIGKYNGIDCVQLTCDGAWVQFNTSQASNFEFMCDQDGYDYDRTYSLEVYVNGIFQYSMSDFDQPDYNPYSYPITTGPNANVKLVLRSSVLNPAGYSAFYPLYITNAKLY